MVKKGENKNIKLQMNNSYSKDPKWLLLELITNRTSLLFQEQLYTKSVQKKNY